jgi:hypothetical protein
MAGGGVKRSATDAPASAAPVVAPLPARQPSRAERARRTAYRRRFSVLYMLLGVVAVLSIGAAVVLIGRGSPAPAPPWSEWEPTGSPERRAAQVGDQVSDPYRLPSGDALATVIYAGPPTVLGPGGTSLQVSAIAVQPAASASAPEDDIDTFLAGGKVAYKLCGLGRNCSLLDGGSTEAHLALLRREALELALYTFKYVSGDVESVLVELPPRPNGQGQTAVFLERSDVSGELSRPLSETLTAPLVPGVGEIAGDELRAVERITRARTYQYGYLQAQDGSPVLVLEPALTS